MNNQFLIYQTDDKKIEIFVRFDNDKETVWLTAN